MAKHRRHHRRRHRRHHSMGSIVQLPFSGALDVFKKEVGASDILIGGMLGLAASGLVKMGANKLLPSGLPAMVTKFWPIVGAAAAGVGLYYLEKKSNKHRANGHLIGAISAGIAVSAWDMLQAQFPDQFSDVVSLRYQGYRGYGRAPYGSVIINEQPGPGPYNYSGLVVNDNSGHSLSDHNLAQLGALSMGGDDDLDGLNALMDAD